MCRARPLAQDPVGSRAALWGAVLLAAALWAPGAWAAIRTASGLAYRVSAFHIEYALPHPDEIPVDDLLDLEVGLRSTPQAYVAPRPVDRTVRMRLRSLPKGAVFSATALQHINQHIVSTFNRRGFHGVVVTVPEIDEETGRDLRPPGDTVLVLRIWMGRVSRLTTVADGPRFAGLETDERTNLAAHDWIRERSPVRPGGRTDLLRVDELQSYAERLSRHPGRRVEVELEPGAAPGTTAVNLRVTEAKPWYAYASYSNTGTPANTRNREEFGFTDTQLLGRDDILSLDYITGDFDSPQFVDARYDSPFVLGEPDWRFRVHGYWSRYDSSELALSGRFRGHEGLVEGQLVRNLLQRGELFVDAVAGARAHFLNIDNFSVNGLRIFDPSSATLIVPHVGLEAERSNLTSALLFDVYLDGGVSNRSSRDLAVIGTENPNAEYLLLHWDGALSFYLEPLIDPAAWEDPSTPGSSTLAHELAFRFSGQWAFDNRLVPQVRGVAGGLDTVRGYDQSEVFGDDLFVGSAEYRLHVPRLFKPDATPPVLPVVGEFRTRAQNVYGTPDWDLILRVFTDMAATRVNDPTASEANQALWSVGVGAELQLLRNLTVRFDLGDALVATQETSRGQLRGHVRATVVY